MRYVSHADQAPQSALRRLGMPIPIPTPSPIRLLRLSLLFWLAAGGLAAGGPVATDPVAVGVGLTVTIDRLGQKQDYGRR
jgi:hypothetical protein